MKKGIAAMVTVMLMCAWMMSAGAELRIEGDAIFNETYDARCALYDLTTQQKDVRFATADRSIVVGCWFAEKNELTLPAFLYVRQYAQQPSTLSYEGICSELSDLLWGYLPMFWEAQGNEGSAFREENIEAFEKQWDAPENSVLSVKTLCYMGDATFDFMIFSLQSWNSETKELYGDDQHWINDETYLLMREYRTSDAGSTAYPYTELYYLITDQDLIADVTQAIECDDGRVDDLMAWAERRMNDEPEEIVQEDYTDELMELVMAIKPDIHWESAARSQASNSDMTIQYDLYVDVTGETQTFFNPWVMDWTFEEDLEERSSSIVTDQYNFARNVLDYENNMINQEIAVQAVSSSEDIASIAVTSCVWDRNEEVAFLSVNDQEGQLIRDELYVFYSYDGKLYTGDSEEMKSFRSLELITDQETVWQIAEFAVQCGFVTVEDICDWVERHREGMAEDAADRIDDVIRDEYDGEQELAESGQSQRQVRIRESGNVNVRQESNSDSAKVGMAEAGAVYSCLSVADNGWFEILLEDGRSGFVSPKMASLVE